MFWLENTRFLCHKHGCWYHNFPSQWSVFVATNAAGNYHEFSLKISSDFTLHKAEMQSWTPSSCPQPPDMEVWCVIRRNVSMERSLWHEHTWMYQWFADTFQANIASCHTGKLFWTTCDNSCSLKSFQEVWNLLEVPHHVNERRGKSVVTVTVGNKTFDGVSRVRWRVLQVGLEVQQRNASLL